MPDHPPDRTIRVERLADFFSGALFYRITDHRLSRRGRHVLDLSEDEALWLANALTLSIERDAPDVLLGPRQGPPDPDPDPEPS